MYGNKGAGISFMTMASNQIKHSSLGDYPVFTPFTITGASNPMSRVKVTTGADYLRPHSDIKIPMGQMLGRTGIVYGCGVVRQHFCLRAVLIQFFPTKFWAQVLLPVPPEKDKK